MASAQQSEVLFSSELFADVQLGSVFEDSKTFADAIAKMPIDEILTRYSEQKVQDGFELAAFVKHHFVLREHQSDKDIQPVSNNRKKYYKDQILEHIGVLWEQLSRTPDGEAASSAKSSLISLPHPYIVPGGRFQEVYYWDTYFTALGLMLDGKHQLVLDTFKNFQFLLHDNGCVPNGNRDYYRGRSQPPVMALLYKLLQQHCDSLPEVTRPEFQVSAIESLRTEYDFWMAGADVAIDCARPHKRIVIMPDGSLLNRYWDDNTGPRPESFKEDIELAESLNITNKSEFYRHIRAACESGWDFSSRWLKHSDDLASIRTCDIVPVDLNCLLYHLEITLSSLYAVQSQSADAQRFSCAATARKAAIQKYLWKEDTGFYHDFSTAESQATDVMSLAATLPLFFNLASNEQAASVCNRLSQQFLEPGGLVTTLTNSPQQWDSPNGWAPLQWFAVVAAENYAYGPLANSVMQNWLNNIEICFNQHPGLMEKYNVKSFGTAASGGEYSVQEGFGWTNGVTRAFYEKTHNNSAL